MLFCREFSAIWDSNLVEIDPSFRPKFRLWLNPKQISKFRRKGPWRTRFSFKKAILNSQAASDVEEVFRYWFPFIIKRIAGTVASGQFWTAAFEVIQFLKGCENQRCSYCRTLNTKSVWITFVYVEVALTLCRSSWCIWVARL